MKLAVIGSRFFKNKSRMYFELNEIRKVWKVEEIVSGEGGEADRMAKEYAIESKIKYTAFPADWSDLAEPCFIKVNANGEKYNALAGFKRNTKISEYSDAVMAFWDGKSPGTKDTIDKFKKAGKKVIIVKA